MSRTQATLHMVCGKIASGKSTLSAQLAQAPDTVLISEDHLLSRLYPGEIRTLDDFARCHRRLREAVGPLVGDLLRSGLSVVLDFQANTPQSRAWMKRVFEAAGAQHQLHLLMVTDEICKARLRERNRRGSHDYQVSDADFDAVTAHFSAPAEEEGFMVVQHVG